LKDTTTVAKRKHKRKLTSEERSKVVTSLRGAERLFWEARVLFAPVISDPLYARVERVWDEFTSLAREIEREIDLQTTPREEDPGQLTNGSQSRFNDDQWIPLP
jgi:hypothetical protein